MNTQTFIKIMEVISKTEWCDGTQKPFRSLIWLPPKRPTQNVCHCGWGGAGCGPWKVPDQQVDLANPGSGDVITIRSQKRPVLNSQQRVTQNQLAALQIQRLWSPTSHTRDSGGQPEVAFKTDNNPEVTLRPIQGKEPGSERFSGMSQSDCLHGSLFPSQHPSCESLSQFEVFDSVRQTESLRAQNCQVCQRKLQQLI